MLLGGTLRPTCFSHFPFGYMDPPGLEGQRQLLSGKEQVAVFLQAPGPPVGARFVVGFRV